MMYKITYSEKLDIYARDSHTIPYRLHSKARYRNNCWYWIGYEDERFKVTEVLYNFDQVTPILDHVIMKSGEGYTSWISTDLTIYDFFLESDTNNIRNDNIINSGKSYTGGEIEYWFFMRNISFMSNRYKNFSKYLNPNSDNKIDPFKYYYIKAIEVNNIYTTVEFITDKTREKFRRSKNTNVISVPTNININEENRKRRRRHEKR